LPSVNEIKDLVLSKESGLSSSLLSNAVKEELDKFRGHIFDGIFCIPKKNTPLGKEFLDKVVELVLNNLKIANRHNLRPVVNATGIVLHTNLGRAPMSNIVAQNIASVAQNYSTLEYNLISGDRGSRYAHVEELICKITGAEAALVVNNNAAAVLLILSALAVHPKNEIIVSRGELVEIGGSFRIPDIMSLGGAVLKEVGTTNKTKLNDYEGAISKKTAAILKVHTSNFKVVGFSHEEGIANLKLLSKKHKIPLVYDFGSGMLDEYEPKLIDENYVLQAIKDGVDLICFSGDKLLGGPQCGIIAGTKEFVERIKKHQLTRVLRVDKLCLSALEPLLRLYLDKERAKDEIPVLKMLSFSILDLENRAKDLYEILDKSKPTHLKIKIVKLDGQVGGGSAPTLNLLSFGIEVYSDKLKINEIEKTLREYDTPIISRIKNDRVLLDVRTIFDYQFSIISNAISIL